MTNLIPFYNKEREREREKKKRDIQSNCAGSDISILARLPWLVNFWKKGSQANTFYFSHARMVKLFGEKLNPFFFYSEWPKYT